MREQKRSQPRREPYRPLLDWYRSLLSLRRARPELTDPRLDRVRVGYDEDARWLTVRRGPLRIAANLGTSTAHVPAAGSRTVLLASEPNISVNSEIITLPPASFAVIAQNAPGTQVPVC